MSSLRSSAGVLGEVKHLSSRRKRKKSAVRRSIPQVVASERGRAQTFASRTRNFQAPSTNDQRNLNDQFSNVQTRINSFLEFVIWLLVIIWLLGFVIWNFSPCGRGGCRTHQIFLTKICGRWNSFKKLTCLAEEPWNGTPKKVKALYVKDVNLFVCGLEVRTL